MPQEIPPAVKYKIYPEGAEGIDTVWERPGFKKGEIEARVKDVVILRGEPVPNSYKMLVEATFELPKKDKITQLGLVNRHGLVTRVHYASPFKGAILPGDIILQVNGTTVSFDEKQLTEHVDETTGGASLQSNVKTVKRKPTTTPKTEPVRAPHSLYPDFKVVVGKILNSKSETKITVLVARLKNRMSTSKIPNGILATQDHTIDLAILYQFKYLQLGLNVQQVDRKVVVNYTIPDSVSHCSLNIGEAIIAVDDKPINTLADNRQRFREGFEANGWIRLLVEYPNTDPIKNMVRGQLANVMRTAERPQYLLCGDVRKYFVEGIEALKNGKALAPILKEEEGPGEVGKKKSDAKVTKKDPAVGFNNTTEEFFIPAEWNSKLFVWLPPLKTKVTESASSNMPVKK
ncbi:PDZ domain-containing protein [Caenorhabditis elegans]|uniref:PDZ domain-containing protein n=1 Tax=Caenorhabditis elegans TaxID=6239 RepID=Q9TXV1_CAEEL|nr:PDZ domain-containing protein [Caenorhabditis elegans]CCD72222.1 PDZ domain-containing protein [Caenorhabditis elegans]|eukprot:NP_500654.1 Multiple PDZ domain protein [Caenorhabditis elegans]